MLRSCRSFMSTHALPGDLLGVDAQGVALLDVVVQHGGQQVVGRADGVEIAGEVEVDVLHGHHLGVAAAGGAALDAEHRAQGGLPQGDHGVFAQTVRRPSARPTVVVVLPSPAGVGLMAVTRISLPSGRSDLLQQAVVHLGLVPAVQFQILARPRRPQRRSHRWGAADSDWAISISDRYSIQNASLVVSGSGAQSHVVVAALHDAGGGHQGESWRSAAGRGW